LAVLLRLRFGVGSGIGSGACSGSDSVSEESDETSSFDCLFKAVAVFFGLPLRRFCPIVIVFAFGG
jgi:hypothetical protein